MNKQSKRTKIPISELEVEPQEAMLIFKYLNEINVPNITKPNVRMLATEGGIFFYSRIPVEDLKKYILTIRSAYKEELEGARGRMILPRKTLEKIEKIAIRKPKSTMPVEVVSPAIREGKEEKIPICCDSCGFVDWMTDEEINKTDEIRCTKCGECIKRTFSKKSLVLKLILGAIMSLFGFWQLSSMVWSFYSVSEWRIWHPNLWTFSFPFYFKFDVTLSFYIGLLLLLFGAFITGWVSRQLK